MLSKNPYKKFNMEDYFKMVDDTKIVSNHTELYKTFENNSGNNSCAPKEFLIENSMGDNALAEKYDMVKIAGGGDTLNKTLNIMQWLTDHTFYKGIQYKNASDNTSKILRFALQNDFEHAINCRFKAIVLTDLLLCANIIALPLCLIGFGKDSTTNKDTMNCHFMAHVYLEESKEWIVVDPSFNTRFESNRKLMNIFELRRCICNGTPYEIRGYNFNGDNQRCIESYRNIFIKACLEFISTWSGNKVQRKRFGIGNIFNIVATPQGDSYYNKIRKVMGDKGAMRYVKNVIYISESDLLGAGILSSNS